MSRIIEKLCRSCGKGFVTDLAVEEELSYDWNCREAYRFVLHELRYLDTPKTTAAKHLFEAQDQSVRRGKFAMAKELIVQLIDQINQDKIEFHNRKVRDRVKKERWNSRQVDRRARDRAAAHRK